MATDPGREPRPGLDVERLARAMWVLGYVVEPFNLIPPPDYDLHVRAASERIAAEYARLGAAVPVDYLASKDRSMAEHSDNRSACPSCGEWRDSPTSDCAACGYAP